MSFPDLTAPLLTTYVCLLEFPRLPEKPLIVRGIPRSCDGHLHLYRMYPCASLGYSCTV